MINIRFNKAAASIYGLKPDDLKCLQKRSLPVSGWMSFFEVQKIFNIVVRGIPHYSPNVDTLK